MTPDEIRQRLDEGLVLHRAGQLSEASARYQEALQAGEIPDALHLLGIIESQSGNPVRAIDLIRRAIAVAPNVPMFHGNIGKAFADQRQWEDAEHHYRQALALSPDYLEVHKNFGMALQEQGRFADAERSYRAVLALRPDDLEATKLLAALLTNMGRYDESSRLREEYLRERPDTLDFPLGHLVMQDYFDPPVGKPSATSALSTRAWHVTEDVSYFPLYIRTGETLGELVEQCILKDHRLPEPIFPADAKLITFGSCFAEHLRRELMKRGRMAEHIHVPEGLNNSFALRDFFEWVLTGKSDTTSYWYNRGESGKALRWQPDAEHGMFAKALTGAAGLVVTFGLAEVWRDRETGGVFWRGVPVEAFDAARHELVMSSVEDNYRNMRAIHDLVRAHCGDVPLIFTLSPVPLNASFGSASCMESDCVSKATLRLALDRIVKEDLPGLYYWPSFEIVRWLGAHLEQSMFRGHYDREPPKDLGNDNRHVRQDVVACIIEKFIHRFFQEPSPSW